MRSGWHQQPLGDVISLEYGKPLPKNDREEKGAYPAYGANGIKCRTDKYFYDKSSIIVGRKGSAGEVTLSEERFWPLDVTFFVKFNEQRHDLRFLYYLLRSLDLPSLATGVKPGINRNNVYAIQSWFPPLLEQKRIVEILETTFEGIDQAIANTEKNLANARRMFESQLNSLFTLEDQPYNQKLLRELIAVTHGFAFKGPDFQISNNKSLPIVLTPGNYSEDGSLIFPPKKTKRFFADIPKKYLFQQGDLTIVMTDLSSKMKILGKPAFINRPNILHNQRIGRVIFKSDELSPSFLYYFFRTEEFLRQIKETATGTMVRHTAPKRILSQSIPLPHSPDAQQEIVEKLDRIAEKSNSLASSVRKKRALLATLKESILHRALSGELTASDIEQAKKQAVA